MTFAWDFSYCRIRQYSATLALALFLGGCGTGYRRDGNHMVFVTLDEGIGYQSHPISDSDPTSFQILKDGYAKDKYQVYFEGKPVWSTAFSNVPFWSQPTAFTVLSGGYAKDDKFAYYRGMSFDADLSTLRIGKDSDWAADKNDAYIGSKAVHACDPASFQKLRDYWFKDSKCAYVDSLTEPPKRIFEADSSTFKAVNFWFAKDRNNVYSINGAIIVGADTNTFVDGYSPGSGQDASRCFRVDKIVGCDSRKK